jgi:hypothetical protein
MSPGYEEFTPDPSKAALYADRYGAWNEALQKEAGRHAAE